jgi:hypothetical protein
LPQKFEKLASEAFKFNGPIAYYDAFRDFVGLSFNTGEIFIPLLRKLARKAADFTVYEWKYDKAPREIIRPAFDLAKEDDTNESNNDEIDFGDDAEIDFGDEIEIEVVTDDTGM